MAGDWIPMRFDLADDPAVIQISRCLSIDEFGVVGRLHKLWSWANRHLSDGHARSVTTEWVDRFLSTPGFAAAMLDAGWLRSRSGGLEFPNFDRWNSQGAKNRELASIRQSRKRSRSQRDKSVTREEKRREENKEVIPLNPPSGETAAKPKRTPEPFPEIPASLNDPAFLSAWSDWLADRKARGKSVTARGAKLQLDGLATLGPAKAVECIRASIANGWTGLFPDRFRGNVQGNNGQPHRPQGKGHSQADYWADQARKVFSHEQ